MPSSVPTRNDAIQQLHAHLREIKERFSVKSIALFGSVVRNEAVSGSDLDVLVSFEDHVTAQLYFGLQFYLEDLFGCPVDLVTEKALRPELKPFVMRDAVHV
ncbi:nucleotidyltransferase family protein [Marinobacterium sp. AK62]|uniref:Nucleotidyltransferase family protein n=1 Tax=Marinobacterium alkalitolerans TaxID=1542925 RepID=A0ABS3ZAX9_9GAMM|nr:nucleotidyltransferase family protein [Marinobacterium alkalitolerans]MBP0048862.1 nucleotidyltransferase family protein [Marinobacterium alkalitolerans]